MRSESGQKPMGHWVGITTDFENDALAPLSEGARRCLQLPGKLQFILPTIQKSKKRIVFFQKNLEIVLAKWAIIQYNGSAWAFPMIS